MSYSVPSQAKAILSSLVRDERLGVPDSVITAADQVHITGADAPVLPIPWKFTEAISALKGLEGAWASVPAAERYGGSPGTVELDADAASLFVMGVFISTLDGKPLSAPESMAKMKSWDLHRSMGVRYRQLATNIYETSDGRFFHTHGSMNATATQTMLGLEPFREDLTSTDDIVAVYKAAVAKLTAEELDTLANAKFKQAGTICYTVEESRETEQGRAIANCPIYELSPSPSNNTSTPCPWPSPTRGGSLPLEGIKVLELARIIAAPAIARGLAEMGATVIRITSPKLADMNALSPELNQGKLQAALDLKSEEGKARLRELILDCDVFIDGYRPGAIERLGFGREAVTALVKDRADGRGIVYVRENCYGWHGPWVGRSGWQQISDCFTGVSWGFGLSQGLKEPVVPIFPNSDYGTGVIGSIGVMHALHERASKGGRYYLDVSLSYYNLFLISLGQYPTAVFAAASAPFPTSRHFHDMVTMLGATIPRLGNLIPGTFSDPKVWQSVWAPSYGATPRTLAPIVRFGRLKLGFERPPRQNGEDPAEWPVAF